MSTQYQVCIHIGQRPDVAASRFVDLTPTALTSEAALGALQGSDLTAADLRARTLFVADEAHTQEAILMYAALIGFAGRRLEFSDSDSVVDASALHQITAKVADEAERPEEQEPFVQVGSPTSQNIPFVALGATVGDTEVRSIRYAKRVRLAANELKVTEALSLLVAVSALRQRSGADRLPLLVLDADAELEEGEMAIGIDLDTLRRAANELRRSRRIDDRDAIVEPITDTERLVALRIAAAVPIEEALVLLASVQNDETGFWRCPRPDRHRNGDANPSLKVLEGKVRCFRCDPEPVDSLRLLMDTLACGPDDAARALLNR